MGRRNDLDICADMLLVALDGAKKTEIVYQANLNFTILKKYLRTLIDKGLLLQAADNRHFKTTQKGVEFLKKYWDLVTPIVGESVRSRADTTENAYNLKQTTAS